MSDGLRSETFSCSGMHGRVFFARDAQGDGEALFRARFEDPDDLERLEKLRSVMTRPHVEIVGYPGDGGDVHAYAVDDGVERFCCVVLPAGRVEAMLSHGALVEGPDLQVAAVSRVDPAVVEIAMRAFAERIWPEVETPAFDVRIWVEGSDQPTPLDEFVACANELLTSDAAATHLALLQTKYEQLSNTARDAAVRVYRQAMWAGLNASAALGGIEFRDATSGDVLWTVGGIG